jgi:hypothetical protein
MSRSLFHQPSKKKIENHKKNLKFNFYFFILFLINYEEILDKLTNFIRNFIKKDHLLRKNAKNQRFSTNFRLLSQVLAAAATCQHNNIVNSHFYSLF